MEEIWAANPDVKVMYCFLKMAIALSNTVMRFLTKRYSKEFKTVERPTAEVKEEKPTKKK